MTEGRTPIAPSDRSGAKPSLFTFRDRIVCAVCNWLLNHVASQHYRAMVGGSIRYGLRAAAEAMREDDEFYAATTLIAQRDARCDPDCILDAGHDGLCEDEVGFRA